MKIKEVTEDRSRHKLAVELLFGILMLGCVFMIATNEDMRSTETRLSGIVSYINEQCNGYNRMNLASETKSLMRVMEGARQTEENLFRTGAEDEEILKQCVQNGYLTGILLLDPEGQVEARYDTGGTEPDMEEYLQSPAVLGTALCREKSYAVRIPQADDSYVDLAAAGKRDGTGIVVAYYHTPAEYVEAFNLSLNSFLNGYNMDYDGTFVICSGNRIVAANDPFLVDKKADEVEILNHIKGQRISGKLVHTKIEDSLSRSFGLMEHGRDYYIYAYTTESRVFGSTIQNMIISLVIYVAILIVIHTVHWRTTQSYREEQMQLQQEYTEQLQSKNEKLQEAVGEADRANAAKTNFLARMSHDIRTPLNGIIGLLEINEAHPEDRELICANQKKMVVAAHHLLSLLNDILQMSKLESGEIQLAHEVMNLKELSQDVLTIVEQRAVEAGVTLEYDRTFDWVAHAKVYGSPLHVRQIFLNIYGNCIKYNKMGGSVTTSCECVGEKNQIATYRWVIADTGVGMTREFLEHIFDPFSQEHTDARSVYHGTGLGMAIVKSLVDQMGGTIEVTSVEGEGSTFTITLPFSIAAETGETEIPADGVEEPVDIRGLHILLAEDNELNAEIAQVLLGDAGVTITVARDGQEAVDIFSSRPQGTFDGILMDIMMPVMDGLTATETIRALERPDAGTIPIIAMTANAFGEDVRKCLDAGMNDHLAKPLQMEKVTAVIAAHCRK